MNITWILARAPHIGRKVIGLGTLPASGLERPTVCVLHPAILRIDDDDGVFKIALTQPFSSRIAAIHWLSEIEFRIALWNEIAVEIGDGAIGIRVHGVVGAIGA